MSTRFMYKALAAAALGIALSLLLPATTTASPVWSNSAEGLQLEPPAAPSNCRTNTRTIRDPRNGDYTYTTVSWRDNSDNEDGFTLELWRRNESRVWVLVWSVNEAANSTADSFGARFGRDYKFRVKAFNAFGDSAWSNWGH